MLKLEYVFYLLLAVFFVVLFYIRQTDSLLFEQQQITPVESLDDVFYYRHQVLLRGCSIVGDLDQMAKNGTSFEDLIAVHKRVHDLNAVLWESTNNCYEPVQNPGRRYVIYEIFNRENLTETSAYFALPPKCGTTSYQRAIGAELSQFNRSQVHLLPQSDVLNYEFPVPLSASDLHAPHIYDIMMKFSANELPKAPKIVSTEAETRVEYAKRKSVPAIVNTRNPFSRLYAAWSDKFNYKSSFINRKTPNERLKWIYDAVNELEEDKFTVPSGYINSFDAFAKYISISSTDSQNHHWRSLYWLCRPCHMKYEYITRIENAKAESEFIFEKIGFNTHLPPNHGSSTLKSSSAQKRKPTTAENYKEIPVKTIIDIYRKYYLDFVLFGFSAETVIEVVQMANSIRHRFSIKGNVAARKHLRVGIEQQKTSDPNEQYDNCDNLNISSSKLH